mmetsp:Transcript_29679/g.72883  ORF Transcript_29679/g.72883 Transcript_29679/m.72883 type:complete len:333 (+) Transcript_29679:3148-4146(+)
MEREPTERLQRWADRKPVVSFGDLPNATSMPAPARPMVATRSRSDGPTSQQQQQSSMGCSGKYRPRANSKHMLEHAIHQHDPEMHKKIDMLVSELDMPPEEAYRLVAAHACRAKTALAKAPFRQDREVKKMQKDMNISEAKAQEMMTLAKHGVDIECKRLSQSKSLVAARARDTPYDNTAESEASIFDGVGRELLADAGAAIRAAAAYGVPPMATVGQAATSGMGQLLHDTGACLTSAGGGLAQELGTVTATDPLHAVNNTIKRTEKAVSGAVACMGAFVPTAARGQLRKTGSSARSALGLRHESLQAHADRAPLLANAGAPSEDRKHLFTA